MRQPPRWSAEQLAAEAQSAKDNFRRERLDEPLELYDQFFETFVLIFSKIIDRLPDLSAKDVDPEAAAALVRDDDVRTAFRYLSAPPISEDDLKTLAETTLSASALRKDPEQAKRVRDIVLHIIDPHRFPWIRQGRDPDAHEREQAIVASATLVATKKVETRRRMDPSKIQEAAVKELLRGMNFGEVPPRKIPLLDAAPQPSHFCGESKLGDTRADIIVRLYDRRAMPIECKVSNSAANSFKRLIHEAGGKAEKWLGAFGRRQTVPAAVLSGVFKPNNLNTAQAGGLSLFWSHRLDDLADYIESTRD